MRVRPFSVLFAMTAVASAAPQSAIVVAGTGAGVSSRIRVFDASTRSVLADFSPFGTFSGGVRVAAGDVTGDGVPDVIAGAGTGSGQVKVYDGATFGLLQSFFAFDPLLAGGVNLGTGDVDGDGRADIIAGYGASGSVRVFSGLTGNVLSEFVAFDGTVVGGVNVAGVDTDGDGKVEIVTGANAQIKRYDGTGATLLSSFLAFGQASPDGVSVGGLDVNNDGLPDILGGNVVGASMVRGFDTSGTVLLDTLALSGNPGAYVSGTRVDGKAMGFVGLAASPLVRILDPLSPGNSSFFFAFEPGTRAGVYVASAAYAPVPEPATLAALAFGAVFALRRRPRVCRLCPPRRARRGPDRGGTAAP